MFYGLGLGLGAGAGCANALGCDSPLSCGLFCRHRGVDHGYWGAAQTQNGNSLAGAGQGDPGAIQAALLSQQNVAHQATGLPAFAFAGIGASHQSIALVPVPVTSSYTNLHRIEDCDRLSMVFQPGEIIAWRCWRPDRPMTGKIGGNYAGVHAWKEREAARIMFEENMAGAGAWGAVALWGELVEHERGFRAENARVVAIEAVRPSRHGHILGRVTDRLRLNRLPARYGVGSSADYAIGVIEPGGEMMTTSPSSWR